MFITMFMTNCYRLNGARDLSPALIETVGVHMCSCSRAEQDLHQVCFRQVWILISIQKLRFRQKCHANSTHWQSGDEFAWEGLRVTR